MYALSTLALPDTVRRGHRLRVTVSLLRLEAPELEGVA